MPNKFLKVTTALLLVLSTNTVGADTNPSFVNTTHSMEACNRNIPFGSPVSQDTSKTFITICHEGYMTHLDVNAKIPDWVSYSLTEADSMGCEDRSNKFKKDPSVPGSVQASVSDYDNAGYDRGHLANDDDMRWDHEVELESFYMTNMTPQLPHFNRQVWLNLENRVRDWTVSTTHNMNVISGPIYNVKSDKKIGSSNVDVPTGFYKIIIDMDDKKAIAFEFTDQATSEHADDGTLAGHLTSIQKIESDVKITFALPSGVDKSQTSGMWPYTSGEYSRDKRSKCH